MRVALVTSSFLPRAGGVEEHVLHVACALRDAGHTVVVWTVDQGDPPGSLRSPALAGITVRPLPCPLPARSVRAAASFALTAPRALAAWWRALRRDRPQVLHVQCFGPNGLWALALSRLTRTPLVLSSHGETYMDADGVFAGSALLRRGLRAALRRADAVTVCSAYTAADLERRFGLEPGTAEVVPNGIDAGEAGGPDPGWLPERYLLGVGRLVETKGFDLLVEAFAAADLPADLRLVVGGDGPAREDLEELVRERGLTGRVLVPGRLSRPEVVTVMAGALALVVPSRVEAFGITILEGWRAGVPVVATSRGGPPEFLRDRVDGLLVDPLDASALTAALEEIVAGTQAAQEMARSGQERSATFTWERAAASYARLYDRLDDRVR